MAKLIGVIASSAVVSRLSLLLGLVIALFTTAIVLTVISAGALASAVASTVSYYIVG